MKRSATTAILAMATLPGPLFAHGGLDRGSVLMVFVHSAAHAINDHPILTALFGAAVIVGLGIYQRRRGDRRAS
jgi:hypothetical protein